MTTGRFGHARYAQILAQITARPTTIAQVMKTQKSQIQTIREIVWRFERLGLVRVCEWRVPEGRSSFMVPVFVADGGASIPYPKSINRPAFGRSKGKPRSELLAFAAFIRCLRDGASRMTLHEETGMAYMRVSNLIREMRRLKLVHVSDWAVRADGTGKPAEVFTFGAGKDEPRPVTMTRAQIEQRYRQKRKGLEMTRRMIAATAANSAFGAWRDAA